MKVFCRKVSTIDKFKLNINFRRTNKDIYLLSMPPITTTRRPRSIDIKRPNNQVHNRGGDSFHNKVNKMKERISYRT